MKKAGILGVVLALSLTAVGSATARTKPATTAAPTALSAQSQLTPAQIEQLLTPLLARLQQLQLQQLQLQQLLATLQQGQLTAQQIAQLQQLLQSLAPMQLQQLITQLQQLLAQPQITSAQLLQFLQQLRQVFQPAEIQQLIQLVQTLLAGQLPAPLAQLLRQLLQQLQQLVVPVTSNTKITVCHRTGSTKNPFTVITIPINAYLNAHARHGDIPIGLGRVPFPKTMCPGATGLPPATLAQIQQLFQLIAQLLQQSVVHPTTLQQLIAQLNVLAPALQLSAAQLQQLQALIGQLQALLGLPQIQLAQVLPILQQIIAVIQGSMSSTAMATSSSSNDSGKKNEGKKDNGKSKGNEKGKGKK